MLARILMALSCVALIGTTAFAARLSKAAVPMSADEVSRFHAGKTGQYPAVDEYFAEDGTTTGVYGKPVAQSVFAGKWVVVGNTLCTLNVSSYDNKVYTDCNTFWRDGDKVMVLWSTRSTGGKVDAINGYFDASASMRPGNLVADRYKAAGGK